MACSPHELFNKTPSIPLSTWDGEVVDFISTNATPLMLARM